MVALHLVRGANWAEGFAGRWWCCCNPQSSSSCLYYVKLISVKMGLGGLGITGGLLKMSLWLTLAVVGAVILVSLIFIRITTPRLKLETLSRLGWGVFLVLAGVVCLTYLGAVCCA